MMAIGFRLIRWLDWKGAWKDRLPILPIAKVRFCEFWIVAGSVMSVSVGPWLGAACGAAVVSVCRARNRTRALVTLALLVTVVGGPVYSGFKSYATVDLAVARASGDRLQEDSAYRSRLVPLYVPVVEERPAWGWGRNGFPVLEGMSSVDNGYLLIALTYGVFAMCLQAALFLWAPIRLGIFGLPLGRGDPRGLDAFTLMGIYVLIAFINATVAVGAGATESRFLFLIAGWTAALLNTPAPQMLRVVAERTRPLQQFAFRRVMV
jgi:hypothetical protein